jgi:hypothetical protein
LRRFEATREEANAYQLSFWPDKKRAMPGDFIACALFSSLQEKGADYLERSQLASINGVSVMYTGHRLTQVHADVWEAIMHLARQFPEGRSAQFRARQLLAHGTAYRQVPARSAEDLARASLCHLL